MPQKKTSSFTGKVLPSFLEDRMVPSDVKGHHEIWFPASLDDVVTAVKETRDLKTFVRSGSQVTRQDAVEGAGGAVIHLREMNEVSAKRRRVTVRPGATNEQVVQELRKKKLALPIPDIPLKSIVASVIHDDEPSHLMRTLGRLSDYVSEIEMVRPSGVVERVKNRSDASALNLCRASNSVVTELVLDAEPAKGLWLQRTTFPYPGKTRLREILHELFGATDLPEGTDLLLDAFNGAHDLPLVRVSASGSKPETQKELAGRLHAAVALVRKGDEAYFMDEELRGPDVLEAIEDSELGTSPDPNIVSERLHKRAAGPRERAALLEEFVQSAHRALAFGQNEEGKLEPDERIFVRVQVNHEHQLELSGYRHSLDTASVDATAHALTATSARAVVAAPLHLGLTLPVAAPAPTSDHLQDFRGALYFKRDRGYESRRSQYATSSYSKRLMSPHLLAYPLDEADVARVIAYARAEGKKVVARSGGHQYSGKSSGGADTVVLCMDAFRHLRISGNIVEVGPAALLTDIARRFKEAGITIPHGECPKVAIGGHAQTGGYGHLLRSFGLALDRVQAFDIVLADGSLRTVTRPPPGRVPTTEDEELFWGVLGGNAGSFGIVTSYRFECIRDRDHPHSFGFSATRMYQKAPFLALMKEVQRWTRGVVDGTLPAGQDFMMTVASRGRSPFPVLLVEIVQANLGGRTESVTGKPLFASEIHAARQGMNLIERLLVRCGQEDLSELSDSFVRRWPRTTCSGREFRYPYKKRINSTDEALTNAFVTKFVNMIDRVVKKEQGVKLVFQMLIGGGAYRNTPRRAGTSIPHRDYVFCFVFDLFYKEGFEARAEALQEDMQAIIDAHFSGNREGRAFWGTFEDTALRKAKVRDMYYDDPDVYARLQQLKLRVDPEDIFQTSLTVKLP